MSDKLQREFYWTTTPDDAPERIAAAWYYTETGAGLLKLK